MTRDEKIEALAEKYEWDHAEELGDKASFIAGAIAGIRLRDEELLAMEFDEEKLKNHDRLYFQYENGIGEHGIRYRCLKEGARWQFEQFMKILKQKQLADAHQKIKELEERKP